MRASNALPFFLGLPKGLDYSCELVWDPVIDEVLYPSLVESSKLHRERSRRPCEFMRVFIEREYVCGHPYAVVCRMLYQRAQDFGLRVRFRSFCAEIVKYRRRLKSSGLPV